MINGGIIHNSLKLETTRCQPTGEWENKIWNIQNMEYPYNRVQLSNKMERTTDTHNMDES